MRSTRIVIHCAIATALAGTFLITPSASAQPKYSWQNPHAKVLSTGDLEWAPQPLQFQVGQSVRYVDFEDGNDNAEGTKDAPWKHHPWDAAAEGNARDASGVDTYIFKGGVTYRGTIVAKASGQQDKPIRLTSDPSWGTGPAVLSGGHRVTGNWTRADVGSAPAFPEPEKLWYIDLPTDVQANAVWEVRDGNITRIPLARDPNWTVTDPDDVKSQWYTWQSSTKEEGTNEGGEKQTRAWAVDPKRLTETDPDAFKGGTVWTEYVSVMGQPYPALIEAYDPTKNAIKVGGPWGDAASYAPIWMNRYYLENLPRFLDSAGEHYFDKDQRRLYVRLPEDRDPNSATIEVAHRTTQIDIRNQSHIHVSGLSFQFANIIALTERWWTIAEEDPAGVKVLGNCSDIRVSNCNFQHLPQPIYMRVMGDGSKMTDIAITDNDMAHTDYGGIEVLGGGPDVTLDRVSILRNRITEAGMRPRRAAQGHTLTLEFARTAEVAGNILHRTGGAGLFIFGGKPGGMTHVVPVSRVLVHHNKVTDSLLWTNDYGGIETWQGGTFYVYNNISGNPGGYWHFGHMGQKDPAKRNHATARFGFAYYFDGSFKNYVFNNIAWGKSSDLSSPLAATTAFHEVIGFLNTFANNTAYRFVASLRRQAPQGGRGTYIGNVLDDATEVFFRHADVDRPQDVNLERATQDKESAANTLAYASNVFFGNPRHFGYFDRSTVHKTIESFRAALEKAGAVASQTGYVAQEQPLRDPANFDFRPAQNSAAKDRGVKHFVPWALAHTVGEWHFRRVDSDPTKLLGDHWYMTAGYTNRETYRQRPRNDLKGVNVNAQSYTNGSLEDWSVSALKLNGSDQYAVLPHDKIDKEQSLDMDTNSFTIEAFVRPEPGRGGVIAAKLGDAGYRLGISAEGHAEIGVRAGGAALTAAGRTKINDGAWHHVLAEVDRANNRIRIYVDGKEDGGADGTIPADATLSNTEHFLVGATRDGEYFTGEIDFLRVARGTLADASTNIDELYAWQFSGPFLRDFTGAQPSGKRDAGAIEAAQ